MRAPRENASWMRDLRACGPVQAEAITDLRGLLLRGLAKSFQARGALDQAFVEDVVQQALVHILDHLEQFQGRSRFTTWAMAIAVRLAMNALRRKRWQDRLPGEHDRTHRGRAGVGQRRHHRSSPTR
jgi:RNA polymerase sigma-70 factor, ECF subfamily